MSTGDSRVNYREREFPNISPQRVEQVMTPIAKRRGDFLLKEGTGKMRKGSVEVRYWIIVLEG